MQAAVPSRVHRVPSVLWVAVVSLIVLALAQFALGVTGSPVLGVAGLGGLVLAWGLLARHRWAHAVTAAVCVLAPMVAAFSGEFTAAAIILLANMVFVVPLVMTSGWFWDRDRAPVWLR
ncbi:MAG: hypothetical protein AAGB48_05390 [Planctomycetota bacterium]